jgi:biotin/methionine sulfoxide reductase
VQPNATARDDYDIFSELSQRLGTGEEFTEGRSAAEWLRVLYQQTASALGDLGQQAPDFDEFWRRGELELPLAQGFIDKLTAFHTDPEREKLATPSGKIEIYSNTIASFGYDDCPGHPAWLPPSDGHGSTAAKHLPLQLIANQPATRLHSQLDFGGLSAASKVRGREPMQIHPVDAMARGIRDGDIVRLFNDRGACLAGAILSEDLRPGVVQLSTGAWYDPDSPEQDNPLCVHGNPNVLTRDTGTSRLAQGCTGQLTCVQVELFAGNLPPIRAFDPPLGTSGTDRSL